MKAIIRTSDEIKSLKSEDYNYIFKKTDGLFLRWGKDYEDDPQYSPFGPEILDLEVTTSCAGGCPWCYKSNIPDGKNMSLETFKTILDKMPKTITQIAYGADGNATSNPDLFLMMEYAHSRGIISNITVADISNNTADLLTSHCGAVAVSRYDDKNKCYDSVKRLTDRGLKQVNIHQLICNETLANTKETLRDYKIDTRLANLNAIIFLSLKRKGRGERYTPLKLDIFKDLMDNAFKLKVPFGLDSCSAGKFLSIIKDRDDFKQMNTYIEPCESACFSSYIDVDGNFFPCSFASGTKGWETGISILKYNDFLKDIWFNDKVISFRKNLINHKRCCPIYEV